MLTLTTRRAAALLAAALGLAAAACNDAPTEDGDHADFVALQMTVTPAGGAAVTYTVRPTGVTPGPVALRAGEATVTFVGLDDQNRAVPIDADNDVRVVGDLRGGPLPTGLTYKRTDHRSGTLTAGAGALTATAVVQVMHDDHSDFDASLPITVRP